MEFIIHTKVSEENEERERQSANPAEKRQQKKEMTVDERKGIMSHPIFPSLDILDFGLPQLHTQMGFGNATMDSSKSNGCSSCRSNNNQRAYWRFLVDSGR
jgi:hypothetical protein